MKAISEGNNDILSRFGAELVTITKASELTGYSESAIRNKIFNGIWPENIVWKWGPDGVQLIIMKGYNTWTKQTGKASQRGRHRTEKLVLDSMQARSPSDSGFCLTGTNTGSL